jgi:3-oxoacyl-[acyl-carrier protein] reductase
MAALHRHSASCSDSSSSSRRLHEIGSNVPSLGDFTGKLVLVTGAGHGIGRHVAVLFQRLGASVWGADLRFDDWGAPLDGAELVASPLADERVVDVTDPIAVRRWVRDAEAAHSGAVFVLINCAGGVGGYP